ncbi:ribulose phosphate epimerase [Erysipelotrichaceae bacterium MTC7]|nr:ribulose phosphate epimerase [Erysipelotrichaceae bacterium MTC7]
MEKLLCPSIMCANFDNLAREIKSLNDADIDIFHCDIMDGTFVPNITMGTKDIQTIRKYTDKLIDCHLMIENPSNKVDWFIDLGVNIIYIHPESERYTIRTLQHIRNRGVLSGIAINPDTSVSTIEEILPFCDYVMVMTVNPGFAGQQFIEPIKKKINKLVSLKEKFGYKIMIDGACSPTVIEELSKSKCDGFILGTSALFNKGVDYTTLIKDLRKL